MRSVGYLLAPFLAGALLCSVVSAQQVMSSAQAAEQTIVPRLVSFSGRATGPQGKTISGPASVTFAIYRDQSEGSPLWLETQNVMADGKGNYGVQLGATQPGGLPLDLFSSGDARWMGVRVNGSKRIMPATRATSRFIRIMTTLQYRIQGWPHYKKRRR